MDVASVGAAVFERASPDGHVDGSQPAAQAGPSWARLSEEIRAALARQMGSEPPPVISDDDLLADLGVDSVVLIGAVSRLERRYGIALSDDSVFSATTFASLVDALRRAALARRGR
uniref:Acyl carrier protein n=1 Tax=Marinactinospora thermotolerans TaxID=531310 RepID=G8HX39_9ACTN|nr:acyl carrier protein [Marinactinospora thermotolerans]